MKKILNFFSSEAAAALVLTACTALCVLPLGLHADMVWQQPLTLARAENMLYGGQVAGAPDGSYSLAWSGIDEMGIRQIFFQRFSPSGLPLSAEPTSIPETPNHQVHKLIRTTGGNYLLLTKTWNTGYVHRLDPDGNLMSIDFVSGLNVDPDAKLELVPDLAGGAWVSAQEDANSLLRINHIDAEGHTASWSGLWFDPVNTLLSTLSFVPQADGSVLCGLSYSGQLRLMRITADLQVTMDVSIATDAPNIQDARLFEDAAGNLIWIYHKNLAGEQLFRAIKTSNQGILLWDQPLELEDPAMDYMPSGWDAVKLEDGTFVFSYAYRYSSTYAWAQRFDTNGTTLYSHRSLVLGGGTEVVNFNDYRLVAGAGSEAWLLMHRRSGTLLNGFRTLWLDAEGFAWPADQEFHYTQHYSVFGAIGMGAIVRPGGLKLLAHHNQASQSSILSFDISPQQGTPTAVPVHQSSTAFICEHTICASGANILSAWIDNTQPYLWPASKDRVRYQIANPLGQELMPQDGEIVSGGTLSDLVQLGSLGLPDGKVLLWWVDMEGLAVLRGQLIAPDGSQLWEEGGRVLMDGPLAPQRPVMATHYQDDVYLAWVGYGSTEIRGQRFSNWIPQWESSGRALIASANVLYPSDPGIKLEALQGDCLAYSCGGTYQAQPLCIALLRFDQNGLPQAGFGPGGNQTLFYSGNEFKHLRFSSLHFTPNGYLVNAITYDGYIDPINGSPAFEPNGSSINFMGLTGVAQWGPNGGWDNIPWYVNATDDYSYYVSHYPWLHRKDWNGQNLWTQGIDANLQRAVKTQAGRFIGIADDRRYYTFSDQGTVGWPHDHQLDANPLSISGPIALGGNAYMSWKGNWNAYLESFDPNAGALLLLQRFSEALSPNGDPHSPALSDQISISSVPNPFRTGVSLQVSCKQALIGEVSVYNLRGQKISDLHKGELPQGASLIAWDGKDAGGQEVAAGIYFVRIHSPGAKPFIRKLMKL